MKIFQRMLISVGCFIGASTSLAFGVDYCFTNDTPAQIQNCIDADPNCRKDPPNLPSTQASCRVQATAQSLSGLSGSNTIIGGRNSVHTDSTYLMAQLIGFSAWQAYQMAIYSEATDQAQYVPFDQNYDQMLTDEQVSECTNSWGQSSMPRHCLIMTPYMSGVYKFNSLTGGMLLHLHARFSPDGNAPPVILNNYPNVVYLNAPERQFEQLLKNLQDWVFDRRYDACAAGITKQASTPDANFLPCESTDKVLNSPMNFFAFGFSKLAIPFVTNLGPFIIHEGTSNNVYANDDSFGAFISPHQVAFAKFGIFLHSYEDRYSHHMCTDVSYFYKQSDGNYTSSYGNVNCAQGSHFWWHVLEQGTNQATTNIPVEHQTVRYALSTLYDELISYANHLNIDVAPGLNKTTIIDNLVNVIQIQDPATRVTAMKDLMVVTYNKIPLPGYGVYYNQPIDNWLNAVGAPTV
jgi:hypothetical protein